MYIKYNIVEIFHLQRRKHKKSWLVQLATRDKRKINELVKYCSIDMNGLCTKVDVNIIPFDSYDFHWNVLVGKTPCFPRLLQK
jgi:hypothetical protein